MNVCNNTSKDTQQNCFEKKTKSNFKRYIYHIIGKNTFFIEIELMPFSFSRKSLLFLVFLPFYFVYHFLRYYL